MLGIFLATEESPAGMHLQMSFLTIITTTEAPPAWTHTGLMFQSSLLLWKNSPQGCFLLTEVKAGLIFHMNLFYRYGASFNAGAGLEKMTARNWDDYVDVANAYATRCDFRPSCTSEQPLIQPLIAFRNLKSPQQRLDRSNA